MGAVSLSVRAGPRGTALDGLRQDGSLKVVFPRTASRALQAVLVNTAGGITGGDEFAIDARAARGATLTLTTQAAERAYRAQPGETGRLTTRLAAEAGARLHWVPQETILFDGCALERLLRVDMSADARVMLAEPLIFGRAAMGERLRTGWFRDRIEVWRGGAPLLVDAMALEGDMAGHLDRPHVADGAGAMVSLLYVAPDAAAHLDWVRAALPDTGGVSLVRDTVLFLRALAPDGFDLRAILIPILHRLGGEALPRPWMI